MAAHSMRCNPNRLKLFLDDELSEDGQTELAEHLDTCEACQLRLESLAADPAWWSRAQQWLHEDRLLPTCRAPELESMAGPKQIEVSSDGQPSLDFLAPTDDPTKLGRLGPYEVSGVIGYGGMGVVLKGFDPALNRSVAIKVLAPQLAAVGAARQRFAREARAAAAVDHEHVVAIHAVALAGSFPYFVMPLVRGESLQKRIDRTGALELKEILRIGTQIAAGLAAAYAQGLVHRDIKPGNILLEVGVERVKITDFGLARTIDDATMTCSGVVAGTPQYMAPEQAKGDPVNHRTDLFSLGSVMYAMCTGRSPFRAPTTMAVLRRVCEETPRPIREVNPEIPQWLAEIIEKLLEKDPAERFQSASELAELLGQHLAHLQQPSLVPMPARLPGRRPSAPVGKTPRGRRKIAATLFLLLVALAASETLRITHVVEFVTGRFGPPPSQSPQPRSDGEAPGPEVILVTPEMVQWDDGLDERFGQLHRQIHSVQAYLVSDQKSSRDESDRPLSNSEASGGEASEMPASEDPFE